MNIIEVKIGDIKAYSKNAKKHNEKQITAIAKSIEKFGFRQPLVIDKNNEIVVGHGRYLAAVQLGMETVPCEYADDLTDEQIKAYRLADNKLNESPWDFRLVDEELEVIKDFDMSEFGFEGMVSFDESSLDELFMDAPPKEKEAKKVQCPHCGEWIEV